MKDHTVKKYVSERSRSAANAAKRLGIAAAAAVALLCILILASCGPSGSAGGDPAGPAGTTEHLLHSFGEWAEAVPAGCQDPGTEKRTCACGAEETRKTWPLGHSSPDAEGKCSRCGELLKLSVPADRIEKLPGTIVTKTNKYNIVAGYYGAVIDLSDISFNTVTLTRAEGRPELGYAFLRELPAAGSVPSYSDGYTEVVWDSSPEATFAVPGDAKFMYVYHSSNGVIYLPEKVEFFSTEEKKKPGSFTVATWNIGHFSKGSRVKSDFADSDYGKESAYFKTYIDACVGADIIALAEYSSLFTPSNPASSLFDSYTGASFEGEQRRYSCNAIYSKLELKNFTVHEFKCNKNAVITYTTAVKAPDYYYITADLDVGGEKVTLVALHLAYDDRLYDIPPYVDTVCQNQMKELIDEFSDVPRVIMLGDWNAYSPDYFDLFTDAGYTVCNDGSLLTCTGSKTGGLEWAVDNIIVKGLKVSDFRKIPTGLSDHVAVVATLTPVS